MNIKPGNRFFIENVREALTSSGEWYLDKKTGELLYWPIEPNFPKNIEIVVPIMDRLIVLQGDLATNTCVKYINFQALTFKDSDYTLATNYFTPSDAAIWLSGTQHFLIENCHFMRLGGHAIQLEKSSCDNQIIRNKISQMGQGGVLLSSQEENDQPKRNLVVANTIHDCRQIYKHVAGVFINCGSENCIAYNRIFRMPRYGIGMNTSSEKRYSFRNTIEFNEISDVCLETSETGAIMSYTAKIKALSENIIRYNFIKNVVGMNSNEKESMISPYYTWGVYLDAYSSGTEVYGNIIINTVRGGIFINGGKSNLIENNIIVNGIENQLYATR